MVIFKTNNILIALKPQYLVTYPVSQGAFINCAALTSNPSMYGTIYDGPLMTAVSHEELLAAFQGWETQASIVLNVSPDIIRRSLGETLMPQAS